MEMILRAKDRVRLTSINEVICNSFIDVEPLYDLAGGLGTSVDFYPIMGGQKGNFQIREKDGVVKAFHFEKAEYVKDYNFGWWNDANVIWTNE